MSRDDASAEAVRLATELIMSQNADRWDCKIVNSWPCTFDPKPIGKTPSRWYVGTTCTPRDSLDTDGATPGLTVLHG